MGAFLLRVIGRELLQRLTVPGAYSLERLRTRKTLRNLK